MDSEYEVVPLGGGRDADVDDVAERAEESSGPWDGETVALHTVGDEEVERAARLRLVRSRRSRHRLIRRGAVAGALVASIGLAGFALSGGGGPGARGVAPSAGVGQSGTVALGPARAISTPTLRGGRDRQRPKRQRGNHGRPNVRADGRRAKQSVVETTSTEAVAEAPANELPAEPVQESVSPDPVSDPPPPPPKSEAASAEFGFEH
jgi:hypothetical protein